MAQNLADKAYARIKSYGWIQEALEDRDWNGKLVGVCLLGGIGQAAFKNPEAVENGLRTFYHGASTATRSKTKRPPSKFHDVYLTVEAFATAIKELFPDRASSAGCGYTNLDVITEFNDDYDTTIDDIRLVCKKASSILDRNLVLSGPKEATKS